MPDSILPLSIITSFLSNLTVELLGEKILSRLGGIGDADKKNLNQAFKSIGKNFLKQMLDFKK